jgi:hypothetical protein
MSALSQKQTFAPQKVMSALPPKADMCCAVVVSAFGQKRTLLINSIDGCLRECLAEAPAH